ncbi:PREDICTED: translation initiation factor eIF-2B subunit delta [Dinoponera quadriceps]|uniref:Translation initiation factor eIF2B subunit delta n=1 Tax=Dinoponera quadriceps TaxID=609295 RepID=A0A6P3WMR3_DINQU|nr:PREDICTED: translation initiation factor eIF-2B subunit delta [Dinoponera quadriceps]XP_014467394.1 PREDICTED: translation initiation factor eIF-2B subunit delta [Dinoponera quadriceps]XP_014467395.1 PREDICTED: translation initiation factor eIF-2B subunit delta [Dinoponera quadriceps]XP_014467396.1 PREDICTED: translation initiation factor eIF-2B subunit delta [Dinoponera quadriceps]
MNVSISLAANTAEGTFHSPLKTREEMSVKQNAVKKNSEMNSSKAAELGCSNDGVKNEASSRQKNPMKSPGKGGRKSSGRSAETANSRRTDVAADSQSSQSAKNTGENSVQNDATSKNAKSSGPAQKPVSTSEKAAEKSAPEKTGKQMKARARKRTKAKGNKAAAGIASSDNNAGPSMADGTSPGKSVEMSVLEDAPGDSKKPHVVSDARCSQSERETEPRRKAKENSGPTTISEGLNSCSQESASSKTADGESSLPGETNVASDSRSSQSPRGKAISPSEEVSKAPSREPSSKTTADDKSSLPEKTREEVKAEREAKKAAKAAAKAKAKSKKTEEAASQVVEDKPASEPPSAEQISTKSATVEHVVADAQSSWKTDIAATSLQALQVAKKTEESSASSATRRGPNAQAVSVEFSTVSRQGSATSDGKSEDKSKAELRAERRAKQEAQRAAKQQQQAPTQQQQSSSKSEDARSREATTSAKPRTAQAAETAKKVNARKDNEHEVNLFKHLYNEREHSLAHVPKTSDIHPAIIGLGAEYSRRMIVGSNARCLALLTAVKEVIRDFVKPEQADFTRSLEVYLRDIVAYLHNCRPVAVSMQNAIRHLKWHMTNFPVTVSTDEAKTMLTNIIDIYKKEQIQLAGEAISITIQTKISNGNIILIYGFSSLICNILMDAHAAGTQFRVIVVDGRPWLEGREQLRRLVKHGIKCSYMFINAVSFIMPEVSKVFLGAHAILANGAVMSRIGTSQIALIAKAFNVPVLVACETHKTCGRVQTDSIVYNELGDADDLVNSHIYSNSRKSLLTNWRARKSLNLLNIIYDVTPADLITAVVTELAILPCTSVPVILRIKPSEF